jgi:hypothetical protein
MMLTNLAAIVGNYLAIGVRFFILAKAVRDAAVEVLNWLGWPERGSDLPT